MPFQMNSPQPGGFSSRRASPMSPMSPSASTPGGSAPMTTTTSPIAAQKSSAHQHGSPMKSGLSPMVSSNATSPKQGVSSMVPNSEIPPLNNFNKIHFLPTRRGAQLKLFHNVNFFRTDKHFQLALEFQRDVNIKYITFQWQYCTETGWETFTTEHTKQSSGGKSSKSASSKEGSASNQGQKPFVLIHKLNVEKSWLKMEVQFPIGSVALKGKQVKWKLLKGGKMFRVVMSTYLSVEGSSTYEKQRVLIPYVIDNKRSKENEKIERIHAHFKEVPAEDGDKNMILDENDSHYADRLQFDTQAQRVTLKELEFLHVVFPPHLIMSNHVLTEVMSRSSRESSPMSSVSSPGSTAHSTHSMNNSMDDQSTQRMHSTGPFSFANMSDMQSFAGGSSSPMAPNLQGSMSFPPRDGNIFMTEPYIQSMQNQIQRMFQEQQMQQQVRCQQQMKEQYQQQLRAQQQQFEQQIQQQQRQIQAQQATMLLSSENNPSEDVTGLGGTTDLDSGAFEGDANINPTTNNDLNNINEDMDLSFIDEFEHHHFTKLNQSMLSFQNIPQLSDVPEMPQKKRRRKNSNEFFGTNSSSFAFDNESRGDHLDRAILDFAPLNTHSSVSLLGSFRDLTLGNDYLQVYFGFELGTILNITGSCISVLTPIYKQPSEVSITLQKNFQIIPKQVSFRFVQDFNSAASQLATGNQRSTTSNTNTFSSSQKESNSASFYYNDGKPATEEFVNPQNHWANSVNPMGQSLLHVFSEKGLPDYVSTCLRIGIPPTKRDNMYRTPLHLAAARGHTLTAKLLLKCAGLNLLTWRDEFDETPLDLALRFQQLDFIEFVFKWVHVSFLPSKVYAIKQRFWYIFDACRKARVRSAASPELASSQPASATSTSRVRSSPRSPTPAGSAITGVLLDQNRSYAAQVDEQTKLIAALRKRLSQVKLENENLQSTAKENKAPRVVKQAQRVQVTNSSGSTIEQPSKDTSVDTVSDSLESPVLSRLKTKTLEQQSQLNAALLTEQLILSKQLKQQLIFSQIRNRQFELEYADLVKDYNESLNQLAILKTRSRKHSLLNMVSHGESPNFLESDAQSVAHRLRKVNANAWKQFAAILNMDDQVITHNSAVSQQEQQLLRQLHFTTSENPIFQKLMASHHRNNFPLKEAQVKSLKLVSTQFENEEKIKESIFGVALSNQERQSLAYVIVSPFVDHTQKTRSLLSDMEHSTPTHSFSKLHTALLINNCLVEWQEDSLVNLRRIPESHKSHFTLMGMEGVKVLPSKQAAIVQQIVTWNRTKEYDPVARNCQHFVDSLMALLLDKDSTDPLQWTQHCKDSWYLLKYMEDVRSDASLAIPHTYLRLENSTDEGVRINFYSQADVDEYMRECCQDMSLDEALLLQSFDSVFHFFQESDGVEIAPQQKGDISNDSEVDTKQLLNGTKPVQQKSEQKANFAPHQHVCPLQLFEESHGDQPKAVKSPPQNRMRSNSILYREKFPQLVSSK